MIFRAGQSVYPHPCPGDQDMTLGVVVSYGVIGLALLRNQVFRALTPAGDLGYPAYWASLPNDRIAVYPAPTHDMPAVVNGRAEYPWGAFPTAAAA